MLLTKASLCGVMCYVDFGLQGMRWGLELAFPQVSRLICQASQFVADRFLIALYGKRMSIAAWTHPVCIPVCR